MEPVEYLRALRRRWYLPVLCLIAGGLLGWFTTPSADVQARRTYWRATHTLLSQGGENNVVRTAYLTTVGDVPDRVAARLGEDSDELSSALAVAANPALGTIEITTVQDTEAKATAVADAFAEELVGSLQDQATSGRDGAIAAAVAELDRLRASVASLDQRIDDSRDATLQAERDAEVDRYRVAYDRLQGLITAPPPSSGLVTVERAKAVRTTSGALPEAPTTGGGGGGRQTAVQVFRGDRLNAADEAPTESDSSPLTRAAAAGIAGLFVGSGLALLADRLDVKIRSRREAEELFGAPVLATVPRLARRNRRSHGQITVFARPFSAGADAYRRLRTTLELTVLPASRELLHTNGRGGNGSSAPERHARTKVLLVTSALPGEGKTTVVANLAAAFSEAGQRVLVCDCDFRRSSLRGYLRPTGDQTLAGALASGADHRLDDVVTPTSFNDIWMLRAADDKERVPNPTGLLAVQRSLIDDARRHADVILVDTAPLLSANDVNDLLPAADAVLVVSRVGLTGREPALALREMLELVAAPFVGVVLVGVEDSASSAYADERRTGEAQEPSARPSPFSSVTVASPPPMAERRAAAGPVAADSGDTALASPAPPPARPGTHAAATAAPTPAPEPPVDLTEPIQISPVEAPVSPPSPPRRRTPPPSAGSSGVSRLWRRP